MNTAQVLIHGTLNADGSLTLDHTPALPAGPVEVLIRALPATQAATETWWEFLERSRTELLAQGHAFRTRKEIEADRARGSALDEERQQNIARAQAAPE